MKGKGKIKGKQIVAVNVRVGSYLLSLLNTKSNFQVELPIIVCRMTRFFLSAG